MINPAAKHTFKNAVCIVEQMTLKDNICCCAECYEFENSDTMYDKLYSTQQNPQC